MIRIENLSKTFILNGQKKIVADNINITFPTGESVALLGRNGAGKSSLLGMISGALEPDCGRISYTGTLSWPVGFFGSFHQDLTGAQNIKFIARVYGVDTGSLVDFVEDFAELGAYFHLPVRAYSAGMKSRLSFGVSMGIHFDTYLVDEVSAAGDANFKMKSRHIFDDRMRSSGAIVITHSMILVRRMCQSGAILENGKLTYFADVEEAIACHQNLTGGEPGDD